MTYNPNLPLDPSNPLAVDIFGVVRLFQPGKGLSEANPQPVKVITGAPVFQPGLPISESNPLPVTMLSGNVNPTPTPAPSIQRGVSVETDGTPQVGEQIVGVDPIFSYAGITRRQWLRGTTVLASGTNLFTPDATGTLTWSVDGVGTDGTPLNSKINVTIAAASAPNIKTPASVTTDGTPQVGESLTGVDPVFEYAEITSRKWLRGTTVLSTGSRTITPDAAGTLTWSVDGLGNDGTTINSKVNVVVAEADAPAVPSVQTPASITSDGTPQVSEQLIGVDPVFRNATIIRRRWLRGSTVLVSVREYVPTSAGDYIWSVDGEAADGTPIKQSGDRHGGGSCIADCARHSDARRH